MENLVKLVNATSDPESELNIVPPEFEERLVCSKSWIYHTFVIDEETKEQRMLIAKIVSQVRVGRNRSHFNIMYDDFGDKYWTYQILPDYFEGDLIFE